MLNIHQLGSRYFGQFVDRIGGLHELSGREGCCVCGEGNNTVEGERREIEGEEEG